MTAITVKAKRQKNDFYATPGWATRQLLKHYSGIEGVVFECCVGAGDIAGVLSENTRTVVVTNDIDQPRSADFHVDLSTPIGWRMLDPIDSMNDAPADWIVTNPPFCHAPGLVPLAYEHVNVGIAMLLRLSFLEPCLNRSEFLTKHPPTKLIILPRISFTGDGNTDSVTCAWMIWDKRGLPLGGDPIVIVAP